MSSSSTPRALSDDERKAAIEVLHEPRFVDLAPTETRRFDVKDRRYIVTLDRSARSPAT